jgi:tetratricopeptide (TPR) repeat protein
MKDKALAALNLGTILAELGDSAGARAAYQQAINSGHPDHAPTAQYSLGVLLADLGDSTGARAAYQEAMSSGHSELCSRRRGQPRITARPVRRPGRRPRRLPAGDRQRPFRTSPRSQLQPRDAAGGSRRPGRRPRRLPAGGSGWTASSTRWTVSTTEGRCPTHLRMLARLCERGRDGGSAQQQRAARGHKHPFDSRSAVAVPLAAAEAGRRHDNP